MITPEISIINVWFHFTSKQLMTKRKKILLLGWHQRLAALWPLHHGSGNQCWSKDSSLRGLGIDHKNKFIGRIMSPFKVKGKVTKAIESWNERKREEQNIRFLILTPTLLSQSNLLSMVPSLFPDCNFPDQPILRKYNIKRLKIRVAWQSWIIV